MRRLTLILSDLYLPEEVTPDAMVAPTVDLPALDALLRFADEPRNIGDWRHWLAAELDETMFARLPVALSCEMQFLARGIGAGWLATPVHLEARLDHVRLLDRGVLRIEGTHRAAWCEEFARTFGPQYVLHDIGERAFLLTGVAPTAAQSTDPARLLGSDIASALPRGLEAAELRRLGAEIEMWLHGVGLNAERESRREPRVSALWLWGGGLEPRIQHASVIEDRGEVQFHGSDPFLRALAESFALMHERDGRLAPAPRAFAEIIPGAEHVVVELAPMTGPPHESLQAIDAHWFEPARTALEQRALEVCEVVANDRRFRIAARQSWKFWRRRRPWLENLARRPEEPKA